MIRINLLSIPIIGLLISGCDNSSLNTDSRTNLKPFNLSAIKTDSTSEPETTSSLGLMFSWGAAIEGSGVTYTLCEKDSSFANDCKPLATTNELEYNMTAQHLLHIMQQDYFVMAQYGGEIKLSNELSIAPQELVELVNYIKASNTETNDSFGNVLSLSDDGHTLAVGAYFESSAATSINGDESDNSAFGSGAVYVYRFNAVNGWEQEAYIKASNAEASEYFGYSISLSSDGNTLAVSAIEEDSSATGVNGDESDNSARNAGAAYIYRFDAENGWKQEAYIKASNAEAYDWFGYSVSLSSDGNTLAVGAYNEDSSATGVDGDENDNSVSASGAAYVYRFDSVTGWKQEAYVKASNTGTNDNFGYSVSLSSDGNTLAVGAYNEGSSTTGINSDSTDNSAVGSGAAYVYRFDAADGWKQKAYIKASNTEANDNFGYSVSLSSDGNTLAVSAPNEDSSTTGVHGDETDNGAAGSGAAYVYRFDAASGWKQEAYIKASNAEGSDSFGHSILLSSDGNILVVSALGEGSSTIGINGDEIDNSANYAGAAYVYHFDVTDSWKQEAYVKASNTEANDSFGYSLSLSSDGNTLAVSASFEASNATGINDNQTDNSASAAGSVYIY